MYTLIDSPNSLTDDSIAHHMSKKAFHPIEKIDFLTKSIYRHMHFQREMDAKKALPPETPAQLMVPVSKGFRPGRPFYAGFICACRLFYFVPVKLI